MKNKRIAVIGLWHLGCVYAASLAKLGFEVVGFDIDKNVVNNLKRGIPPIFEPGLEETLKKYLNKNLTFSAEEKIMNDRDYIFVTYDIEVDKNDIVQTKLIKDLFKKLVDKVSAKTTIVISSQIPLGTSRVLVEGLKRRGINNPRVIYFPENLRLGQAFSSFLQPDRIILGSDNNEALDQFNKDFSFNCEAITMGLESAEMVKHALNSYLALCISFSGELSDMSEKTGANMLDVVKALKSDKRVSPHAPLNPGLGFGGGTLGRDVQSLLKLAKKTDLQANLMAAVYAVNKDRLPKLIEKMSFYSSGLKGKTIGILGLTYKPNTDTLRRSMSLELAARLKKEGCRIKAFDPSIKKQIRGASFIMVCKTPEDFFKNLDMVVLMTEWAEFRNIDSKNAGSLMKRAVVVDTKNFLDAGLYRKNGFEYVGMGIS